VWALQRHAHLGAWHFRSFSARICLLTAMTALAREKLVLFNTINGKSRSA
jgi:polyphosphate kinase